MSNPMISKRIYLLQHAYVDTWRYVGATSRADTLNFRIKWNRKTKPAFKKHLLSRAFRSSERGDWEIIELCSFVEDWEDKERYFIDLYNTYHNGLNSSADGKTAKVRTNTISDQCSLAKRLKLSKPVLCINNEVCYFSISAACKELGLSYSHVISHLKGKRNLVKGHKFKRLNKKAII